MRLGITDKLSFVLLAWACAFLLPWEFGVPFIALLIILSFTLHSFKAVSVQSRKYLSRFFVYATLLGLVLVIVNGLLVKEGPIWFSYSFLSLYKTGLIFGLTVSVRLILISLAVLVFFTSMHFQDFARYLESAGLPQSLISILVLTSFFLEQLPRRISQIFTAQEARGAPVRAGLFARSRAFFLILSPLVLSSIVESVERGVALELRGYNRLKRPARVQGEQSGKGFWCYVFVSISILIIVVSILRWLSK